MSSGQYVVLLQKNRANLAKLPTVPDPGKEENAILVLELSR